jgi:hypothetical protein
MSQWAGVGQRIRDLVLQAGFTKDGRPDIMRFCDERRYRHTYFYRWVKDEATPDKPNLERLALDLGCTPEYLLFGPIIFERNKLPLATVAGRRSGQRAHPTFAPSPVARVRERGTTRAGVSPRTHTPPKRSRRPKGDIMSTAWPLAA